MADVGSIDLPGFNVPVFLDTKEFDRQVKKDLRERVEKAGRTAGERGGKEIGEGIAQGFKESLTGLQRLMRGFLGLFVVREIIQWGRQVVAVLRSTADDAERLAKSYLQIDAAATLFGVSGAQMTNTATEVRREFQLTATAANEITVQATKLAAAAGAASQAQELLTRALDLGAAQGYDAAQVAQALEQTLRGLDEGTDKLLQKNPSQVYADWAREAGVAAGTMTNLQQKQALVNAIMREGAKVQGAYAGFLATAVGEQVKWRVSIQDARLEIGSRMIPVTNELHRLLAGPFATSVGVVTRLLEGMLSPLERLALRMEDAGIAAEHILPIKLREQIADGVDRVKELQDELAKARQAEALGGHGGGFLVRRSIDTSAEDLRRQRTQAEQQLSSGDAQVVANATAQIEAIDKILTVEKELHDQLVANADAQKALDEAIRRSELRSELEAIEERIRSLGAAELVSFKNAEVIAGLEARKKALQEQLGLLDKPSAPAAAPETDAQRRAREKLASERKALAEQIADDAYAITADATDLALRAYDKLVAAAHEKWGEELPAIVSEGLAKIRADIEGQDTFQGLLDSFEHVQEQGEQTLNRLQEQAAALPEGSPARKGVDNAVTEVLDEQYKAYQLVYDQMKAQMAILPAASNLRKEYAKAIGKVVEAMERLGHVPRPTPEDDQARIRLLQEQARQIEEAARAALQLARAFGIVDENIAKGLEDVVQLAANLPAALAGDPTSILSAVAAAADLISGVFGGGDEEAKQRHREEITSQSKLIRALEDLKDAVLNDVTGPERDAALAEGQSTLAKIDDIERQQQEVYGPNYHLSSVSIEQPERVAQLQRIEDATDIDFLDGNKVDVEKFRAAMKAFQETMLGLFPDSVQGRMDAFDYTLQLLGDSAGDAADRIGRLIEILKASPETSAYGAELERRYKEEGADSAIGYAQGLGVDLASGDTSSLEKGGIFYGLSAEEAQRIIDETLAQLSGGGGGVTGGGSPGSRLNVNLTEVQGSEIISQLGTQTYYLAQIYDVLAAGGVDPAALAQPVTPPSPAALPGTGGGGGGGTTIGKIAERLEINVSGELRGGDPKAIGEDIADGILKRMSEVVGRKDRGMGRIGPSKLGRA